MISRVAIYARESTKKTEQDGALAAQQQRLTLLAARKGWAVAGMYVDRASGTRIAGRPQFQAMIQAAERNAFDAILVTARDRFARNYLEAGQTQAHLSKLGIRIIDESTADLIGVVDEDDDALWFMEGQGDFTATWFSRMQRKKVKRGIAGKVQKGLHWGDVPFGYQRPNPAEPMVPDPEECLIVASLFERYATGLYSLADLARWVNQQGYRTRAKGGGLPFTNSSVRVILHNPVYAGDLVVGGIAIPALHPAIVSRDLFNIVQHVRARAPRAASTSESGHVYLVQGIARHAECGMPLWASHSGRKASASRIPVYRCAARQMGREYPCQRVTRESDLIDAQIAALFEVIELPSSWREQVVEEHARLHAARPADENAQRARLEERLNRTRTALLDGLVPYELAAADIRAIEVELAELQPSRSVGEVFQAGESLTSLHELWPLMRPQERRASVRAVLELVEVDLNGAAITALVPRPGYEPLFAAVSAAGGIVMTRETDQVMHWWTRGVSAQRPASVYVPRWTRRAA